MELRERFPVYRGCSDTKKEKKNTFLSLSCVTSFMNNKQKQQTPWP
jgi:hypothetical protein